MLEPDPRSVPREDAAESGVEERKVVAGMPGRREDLELAVVDWEALPPAQRHDPLRRHRGDRSPQPVGGRGPPGATGARDETRRVDHVRDPELVRIEGRFRERVNDRSHSPGMVQMDVSHEDVADLLGGDPGLRDPREQCLPAGRRTGLHEGPALGLRQQVRGHEPLGVPEIEVEQEAPPTQFSDARSRHGSSITTLGMAFHRNRGRCSSRRGRPRPQRTRRPSGPRPIERPWLRPVDRSAGG